MLAALRYVETRRVSGHEAALRECFTSRRTGKLADEVYAACLDALVATTDRPDRLADFLAEVGSMPRPLPSASLCADGLRRLGSTGCAALIQQLEGCDNGTSRRKLALLLAHASGTVMPKPLHFWKDAELDEIAGAVAEWRAELIGLGRLDVPDESDVEEPTQDADSAGLAVGDSE